MMESLYPVVAHPVMASTLYEMAAVLYPVYAVIILVVAVGGLLAVVFRTPDVSYRADRRYQVLAVLVAVFLALIVAEFLL